MSERLHELLEHIRSNDVSALRRALQSSPIPELNPTDGKPPLAFAKSIEAAQLLIDQGAKVECVGNWWAPGFGVMPQVDPQVGRFLVEQGAPLTPHAAAGLGLVDFLQERIDADPSTLSAKGGDGTTPLHFARDLPVATLLVDRGADVDARDDDHLSTPLQWLIGSRPEVSSYLYEQGATPDIFFAAAMGDKNLVNQLIEANRGCLALRVGKSSAGYPGIGYQGLGGTIYQWTLGFNSYPHQYAAMKGHSELCEHMIAESDTITQFLVACVMARTDAAWKIAQECPGIVESLDPVDWELLARYCWETNVNLEAVRLMLDLGFPVNHPESSHNYSPLHNASFGGYADVVELLLERGADVTLRDPSFHSTPLQHAIHCCCNDGRHPEGQYDRVVAALVDAGSPWEHLYPTGDPRIDAVLESRKGHR